MKKMEIQLKLLSKGVAPKKKENYVNGISIEYKTLENKKVKNAYSTPDGLLVEEISINRRLYLNNRLKK